MEFRVVGGGILMVVLRILSILLLLLGLHYVTFAVEINLDYVGKIECISQNGENFNSFEIFEKKSGYRGASTLPGVSQTYFKYKVFQKFGSKYCNLDDKLSIDLEKPIDAWTLLRILSDIYNLQFLWDVSYRLGNYPVWFRLNNTSFSDFLKFLENKWESENRDNAFPVKFIRDRKLLILGNLFIKSQKVSSVPNVVCPTYTNYFDICEKGGCFRNALSFEDNEVVFVKIPDRCLKTKLKQICTNTKYQFLFIDNANLLEYIKLIEKTFHINFIYSPQDLPQQATSNLHLVFKCFTLKEALRVLTNTFHLYLVKIDEGIYRIYKSKHEYSLILEEASKKISQIFYLKDISANDFVKILKNSYGSKVLYSVDPTFNAVVIIANPHIVKEIQKNYRHYIKNLAENDELISKIYYVKFGEAKDIASLIEEYLSDKGKQNLKILEESNAIEITDYPTNLAMIEKVFGRFLSQEPVKIKVTVKFVRINKSFARSLGLNWGFTYQGTSQTESVQSITGQINNQGITLNAQFLSRKLNPLNISLSAAETLNLSKTLSSPTLILLNNQQGSITSGVQIPYQSVDENGNPKTELVSASLTLNVKPKLLPDGRILLQLQLSKNSPNTGLAVNGQPAINTFQITQNFIINNGETVVIGGVRERTNNEGEAGTPLLKDIPLLGWLFKTKNWDKSEDELLVFITAEVVNQ